jgi:hypothetical protein
MSLRFLPPLAAVLFALTTTAGAQTPATPATPASSLDVTLFDAPYHFTHGFRLPSMQQSLDLSTAGYDGMHLGIERLFGERRGLGRATIVLADILTTLEVALPLSSVWVHEEFHRAAMGRRGVDSHNDVYDFNLGTDWIAVSHVDDAELARIKRDHPADWVRVNVAGIEGELMLVRDLERRRFFGQSKAWHLPLYWLTKMGTIGYVMSGTWDSADADTDEANIEDGTNLDRRDFTGHDFLGWVYDLHRPDEPYEARGVHPSGVGINRYRTQRDLTAAEFDYLKRMGRLQWLNLADPFLFGINDGVRLPGDTRVAVGLSHYLTSFGHSVDTNVLARRGTVNLALTLHAYNNGRRTFPGVDATLVDRPVTILGRAWQVSPRLAVWSQPERQRFDDEEGQLGGLAAVRVRTALTARIGAFVDVEAKSAGWVAGTPYLDRNASLRLGLTLRGF